jgi:dihydroorotase
MKILLKNGRLVNPGGTPAAADSIDLLIDGEQISALAPNLPAGDVQVIDLKGSLLCPGFIDLHVHLRTPGQAHKETLATGLRAAAAGGFTTVFAMPNTEPALDSPALLRELIAMVDAMHSVRVVPVAAATIGRKGEQLSPMAALREAGAGAVSDDGSPIADPRMMRAALRCAAGLGLPLMDHAETPEFSGLVNEGPVSVSTGLAGKPAVGERIAVERDIALAEETGAHLHLCHLSTVGALDAVRAAKQRGRTRITCEAAPHHFSLTESAAAGLDANAKMNPPLRSESDRQAILKGLADGTIDAIATDHAPHADDEKCGHFSSAPDGIIGLESAVPLALEQLLKPGLITLQRLVELFSTNPARIAGRADLGHLKLGGIADITIIALNAPWEYRRDTGLSKAKNSPFFGRTFPGGAVLTIARGRIVHNLLGG